MSFIRCILYKVHVYNLFSYWMKIIYCFSDSPLNIIQKWLIALDLLLLTQIQIILRTAKKHPLVATCSRLQLASSFNMDH